MGDVRIVADRVPPIEAPARLGDLVVDVRGVVPDEPVAVTRASLLAGRDAPLDAALAWVDKVRKESRNVY